jgi:8-oxo-dGTP pyrophosphatase MutT (NUDIX family)
VVKRREARAVTPREAATVMLVRDDPELEVFMLRRNLEAVFMGGAYVFPGGAVDPADRAPELLARCHGRDDAGASAALGVASGGLGFWVAAVREAFEEAGVLLARSTATGLPVDLGDSARAARLDVARRDVHSGDRAFIDVVRDEDVLLDAGALRLFSHWITPTMSPRRYDTWFFLAAAPDGHAYVHDDGETVASMWIRPADGLDRAARGELDLILPTVRNLEQLARFRTARDILDAVSAANADATAPARMVADATGRRILLPIDPGFHEGVA